jgi:LysM repeat protein
MAARRLLLVLLAGASVVPAGACVFGGDDDDGGKATPTSVNQVRGASTAGAAADPSPTPPASPTPARPETYTVKAGDTLSEIAALFDVTTAELAAANLVEDLDTLAIGQVLKIPPK